jgi:hypothetical protein
VELDKCWRQHSPLTPPVNGHLKRRYERLLGYLQSEAGGQSVEMIIPPQLRGPHNAGF